MKKALKILGFTLAVVVFLVVCAAGFVQVRGIPTYEKPQVAALKIQVTPAQLKQGEAIAVSMCADCHLNKQTNSLSGKLLTEIPPEFGSLYAANITQDKEHGIGNWTDAELVALLRTGIGRDGRFRIVMPNFVRMSDEDLHSVIAFLRSDNPMVKPDPTPSHEQEPSLLAKTLVNTVMKPAPMPTAAVLAPPPADQVAYGRYLVVGRYKCYDCHSKDFKSNNDIEPEKSAGYLGGGNKMIGDQHAEIITRNITPDPETGIGDWTEAEFVKAVKYGMAPGGGLRNPMPKFSVMDDAEAKAIFAYLKSVPAIKNATPEDGTGSAVATR
ncbi:c-type cytochrome [Hymenobacter koreensis]|uniref:Cytochrome c domain-containing protein n=1 Tax=Hymenobacter koreensis TaxID=1084523 RepID=A0ABP8JAU9_9BACT